MKMKMSYFILLLTALFIVGCTNAEDVPATEKETTTVVVDEPVVEETEPQTQSNKEMFAGYKRIEVDGGDLSGLREPNVVVDIGYGDREYWAFTNEYGQLVRVIADEIILQDDLTEPVTSSGRYYADEAKVPGVERADLDEGHIIADSLGGVSNAYNITPQDSTLNRHGDQAYMEDAIRKAGGATHFEAIITYPNTKTQIPSSYQYTYTLMGNVIVDTFDNVNPDDVNESLGLTGSEPSDSTSSNKNGDISSVDTNGNGQVTIKEAKAAGFSMPITSDHWLYKYMDDRDGDGLVGE
ncbi:DNA/RNA non-specific endonuclease [Neobacillus niacini]|uniref:DNA/RNA non-specific endonuclease n=1 Tax=Neobacillus niacini TaxID=86668 RepID=UPI0039830173